MFCLKYDLIALWRGLLLIYTGIGYEEKSKPTDFIEFHIRVQLQHYFKFPKLGKIYSLNLYVTFLCLSPKVLTCSTNSAPQKSAH